MDDLELLKAYADHKDQGAFAQLVRRHSLWLYSAARRQLGDDHLAEDATQAVFLLLSRRANSLRRYRYLSGWLFLALSYCIRNLKQQRSRRQRREQEAATMRPETLAPDAPWTEIAPLLESALGRLGRPDREAVLLRFYEQKPLAEVGRLLGVSEEAARKRVNRAVDRLRQHLAARGVEAQSLGLSALILARATESGPEGLVTRIVASVREGIGAGTAGGIAQGAGKMMVMAKVKVAAVLIAASLGAGAVALSQIAQGAAPARNGQAPAAVPPGRMPLSKDDIAAGLKQRETSITDISYRVSTKQYQGGGDRPVEETAVLWTSKGDLFKYEVDRKDAAGRTSKTTVAYDGDFTRQLDNQKDGNQYRGTLSRTRADRDADKLNSESYHLRYNGKYYSAIVSEREFTVERVDSDGEDELYLLRGRYSPSLEMAILVDAKREFYPRKITLWVPSRGHSIEKPTFEYETAKSVLCGRVWVPQECSYRANPLLADGKEVRISKSFSDVKVNQGLSKETFSIDWPKGTEVHDQTLDPEPRGNQ